MQRICIFGAGNIGRSFVGQLFSRAGFDVVFIDVNESIVEALNRRGSYEVVEKSDDTGERRITVGPVRGVHAGDTRSVAAALAETDLAATAVGGTAFPSVLKAIARTLAARPAPLDLIIAENIHNAAGIAHQCLSDFGLSRDTIARTIGLVETSIGKMVPIMPEEVRRHDPLLCWAEPYNTLIVDAEGFQNPIPEATDLMSVSPIAPWVERKLFVHNMGHAATAYLGNRRHPEMTYLWQLLEDSSTRNAVAAAMHCSAEALARRYPDVFTRTALGEHVNDLLRRFGNRALGDTVYRVGRDIRRKLHRTDRIVGAVERALRVDLDPSPIAEVFHAAPYFSARAEDGSRLPGDAELVERAERDGTDWILAEVVGLGSDHSDSPLRTALRR